MCSFFIHLNIHIIKKWVLKGQNLVRILETIPLFLLVYGQEKAVTKKYAHILYSKGATVQKIKKSHFSMYLEF